MKNIYRHGDVNLVPTKKVKGELQTHDGSFILAWGEATGHNHTITVNDPTKMKVHKLKNGAWLLTLEDVGTLVHPEHKPLEIPIGTYRVGGEREKDWFSMAVRRVID